MRTQILSLVTVSALSAFCASSAQANGLVIPGNPSAVDGVLDIRADTVFPSNTSTSEASFAVSMEPNRSYSCTIQGRLSTSVLSFIGLKDPSFQSTPFGTNGNVTPVSPFGKATRVSFTPSGTGTQTEGLYVFEVNNATTDISGTASAPTQARFDCVETTLYGGFNTNVNDFNFLEILNISNSVITGTITAVNSDGTVVINKQPFTVQPNRRSDVDIHTPAGALKYGLISVTHSGPLGAIQAYVSQYDGTASNFALTASIPLRVRDK